MLRIQKHDCKEELRSIDLKATPARLGILAAVEKADKPLGVTDLISYLQTNGIRADRVTVFRIVNTFSKKRLLKPIQFNDGKMRYEHISKADHHHFICEKCGDVEDVLGCNVKILEKDIQRKKKLLIKHHSLEFFGLCQNCQ